MSDDQPRVWHATIAGDPEAAVKYGLSLKAKCGLVFVPKFFGTPKKYPQIPNCPECHQVRPGYVYRCYDAEGRLIYVGCSVMPKTRIEQHRKQAWWFDQVDRIRFTVFPDRDYALHIEEMAIYKENPRWNVKGRDRGLWGLADYADAHTAMLRSGAAEKRITRLLDEARRRGYELEEQAS